MITQEMIQTARQVVTDAQADVFFQKLAALGVLPENDAHAEILWQMADAALKERPRLSEAGRRTKQASCETFGDRASSLASDGCSQDSHDIAEGLCHDQGLVKSAHLMLTVQNIQNN